VGEREQKHKTSPFSTPFDAIFPLAKVEIVKKGKKP
jgi:hypothetical protein